MDTTAIAIMAAGIIITVTAAMDTVRTTAGMMAGRVDAREAITTTGLPARMVVLMAISEADALRVAAGRPVVTRAVQEAAAHKMAKEQKEVTRVAQEAIILKVEEEQRVVTRAGPEIPGMAEPAEPGEINSINSSRTPYS